MINAHILMDDILNEYVKCDVEQRCCDFENVHRNASCQADTLWQTRLQRHQADHLIDWSRKGQPWQEMNICQEIGLTWPEKERNDGK